MQVSELTRRRATTRLLGHLLDNSDGEDALDMLPSVVDPTEEVDTVLVYWDRWTLADAKGLPVPDCVADDDDLITFSYSHVPASNAMQSGDGGSCSVSLTIS